MSQYDELKRLAEAALRPGLRWMTEFTLATGPDVILALIAENERLNAENKQLILLECYGCTAEAAINLLADRDQLRAEVAGLKTGYEAYERVNAELKAEVDGLRKDSERLHSATAFVQKLCDYAGKQPCVATGYLHDILAALGQGEQS